MPLPRNHCSPTTHCRCRRRGRSPVPVVLTFSPCGSVRTLEFMKWLGISFPRWLENELRHSADTLERSVDLCERVFTDVQDYAREKHLPIGINVESVSIRKSEIDASVELFRRLSSRLGGKGTVRCRPTQRCSIGLSSEALHHKLARSTSTRRAIWPRDCAGQGQSNCGEYELGRRPMRYVETTLGVSTADADHVHSLRERRPASPAQRHDEVLDLLGWSAGKSFRPFQ